MPVSKEIQRHRHALQKYGLNAACKIVRASAFRNFDYLDGQLREFPTEEAVLEFEDAVYEDGSSYVQSTQEPQASVRTEQLALPGTEGFLLPKENATAAALAHDVIAARADAPSARPATPADAPSSASASGSKRPHASMEGSVASLQERLDAQQEQIDAQGKQLEALQKELDELIECFGKAPKCIDMQEQLDAHQQQIDAHQQMIDSHGKRLDQRLDQLWDQRLDQHKRFYSSLKLVVEEQQKRIAKLDGGPRRCTWEAV